MVLTAKDMADPIATSVAHVFAAANRRARQLGWDVSESLISITQHFDGGRFWRVNYGPNEPTCVRGGDLIIEVDADTAEIRGVLRGQ
jgi:hypothetical protein